jgi:hypothetical protein
MESRLFAHRVLSDQRASRRSGATPKTRDEVAVVGGCSENVSGNAGPTAAGASQDVPLPRPCSLPEVAYGSGDVFC